MPGPNAILTFKTNAAGLGSGQLKQGDSVMASRFGVIALVATFLAGAAQAAVTVSDFQITRVVDGDTLHGVDGSGKTIKVRMQGIDAPELHLATDEGVFGQLPWGAQSEKVMSSLVRIGDAGKIHSYGFDKYGRTLGQVVVKGMNLNLEMVKRGAAVSYAICPAGDCTEASVREQQAYEFQEACQYAKDKGLGIFDARKPLKEMPFEFRIRMQKRQPDKFVGNLKTSQYVTPERYNEIPVCDRIFFLSEADAQSLGYKLKK